MSVQGKEKQLRRFSEPVVKENYTETPRPSISATSGCVELANLDRRSVSNSKVRIPSQIGHPFRGKSATVTEQIGHPMEIG
jgi:hypothetical protein